MRRFPSFVGLVAFDAVARNGSFTEAARDLGVTQSAVSHQVKLLESYLGTQLIERKNPGMNLTLEGAALVVELEPLLSRLSRIGERRRLGSRTARRVRIGVGSALSSLWLARRIADLMDYIGPNEVDLVETAGNEPELPESLDLTVHWVPASKLQTSHSQQILFREDVFPVCHPSLIENRAPRTLGDLTHLRLLHKRSPADYEGGPEWTWAAWFRLFGNDTEPLPDLGKGSPHFTNIGTVLAAAMEGAGVALGRSLLVHDAIQDGRLVRALDASFCMPSSKVHVCKWHAGQDDDESVALVVQWFLEAGRRTIDGDASRAGQSSRKVITA
jgi:LysR family glycine cleavage system transcriptional activator